MKMKIKNKVTSTITITGRELLMMLREANPEIPPGAIIILDSGDEDTAPQVLIEWRSES